MLIIDTGEHASAQVSFDLFGPISNPDPPPSTKSPPNEVKAIVNVKSETVKAKAKPINDDDDDENECGIADLDLEKREEGESFDTFFAKRMMRTMLYDLNGEVDVEPDMFGHVICARETRIQDALIWMYSLNPDEGVVTFEWVCNELGLDPEGIRHITARIMRQEMKRVLRLIAEMIGYQYALQCELNLQEYFNLAGWNDN